MGTSVVVTGIGCVTALGADVDQTFTALIKGKRGLRPLSLFASQRYANLPVGQVAFALPKVPGGPASRTEQLAYQAGCEALQSAGFMTRDLAAGNDWACVAGTTVAGMLSTEKYFSAVCTDTFAPAAWLGHHLAGSVSETLADVFGIRGVVTTLSTACASGLHAIQLAKELLCSGQADKVLALGADSLSRMTVNGFGSLLIMDPQGAKPFDQDRRGLSLGEAAGALILERAEDAEKRGAAILAWVLGTGNTCDAYHPSAPDPEGRGAEAAMRQALQQAGLEPGDIQYINAHGTGTPDNDYAESLAIARIFAHPLPLVSSIKGAIGHTLGAAGAVESVVCVKALMDQRVPLTAGCSLPDPKLMLKPLLQSVSASPTYILKNAFGFGGNNGSVIFGKNAGPATQALRHEEKTEKSAC